MNSRILLVEDESDVALVVSDLLRAEGHTVEIARDGATGGTFDLLILDAMLPGASGFEICHAAREHGFDGAILMLTARGEIPERVRGLRAGADDYVVKPFDPEELVARVGALLRRARQEQLTPVTNVRFGSVTADFAHGRFFKDKKPLKLTAKEIEVLRILINHRGKALGRDAILGQVWREQPFITQRTVDVHITWLRQKIEDDPKSPRHIITVRGEGYRFEK